MGVSACEGQKAAALSRPNAQVKQLTSVTVGVCFVLFCFCQIATSVVEDKSISISTVCQCHWAKLISYEHETNL